MKAKKKKGKLAKMLLKLTFKNIVKKVRTIFEYEKLIVPRTKY